MSKSDLMKTIIFIFVILTIYLINCYKSIFDTELAYLYHPQTKRLYRIEMAFSLDIHNAIDPFIPFKELNYDEPTYVENIGTLKSIMENHQMRKENFDKWVDNKMKNITKQLQDKDIFFYDLEIFSRNKTNTCKLLPDHISVLNNLSDKEIKMYLSCVDAAIHKWAAFNNQNSSPKILSKCILIEGLAAYKLKEYITAVDR